MAAIAVTAGRILGVLWVMIRVNVRRTIMDPSRRAGSAARFWPNQSAQRRNKII